MFQCKLIFAFVIAVSLIEFSTQQGKESKNDPKKDNEVKEETLAAVRRGDIRGFRRGMNKGGMKAYANMFKDLPYQKTKKIEDAMNFKMFAIEKLMASGLAVPASKEESNEYHFNVTLLPETDVIAQLSLNLGALNNWTFYQLPLHIICSLPDAEIRIVQHILNKGFDINQRSMMNETPLDVAAFIGNLPLVKFLIQNGADPKSMVLIDMKEYEPNKYNRFIKVFSSNDLIIPNGSKVHHNALLPAIAGGHKEIVKYLISIGTDVNMMNQSSAALFYPVIDGKADMVEILLKSGCDVNGRDVMGATALHMAAESGQLEIARLLLNHGANVAAIDNFGWTPLHVAAFSSHNIGLVELLIEAGAPIDVMTDRGFTPLILAEVGTNPSFLSCLRPAIASNFSKNISCHRKPHDCTHPDNIYISALLCNRGVYVNHKDDALGWSVLHWARAIGDENAAKLLVEKCGASDQIRSKAGLSPLDVAKYFGTTRL